MVENIVNKMVCPKCKLQNIEYVDGIYRCVDCGCEWRLSDDEQPKTQSLTIRNSTMEFLIFQAQSQANGVEVLYAQETIWCTQEAIAELFSKSRSTIMEHLQNIFNDGELKKEAVCRKFRRTAADGKNYINVYDYEKIHYQHGSQRPLCCGYDRLRKRNE